MNNNNEINSNYSIVGRKLFVGFSGLVLFSFVIGHLLGNLTIFAGQDAINAYAHFLHKNTRLLNIARAFLLANVFVHVYFSISITMINRAANQIEYAVKQNINNSFASSTMIISGLAVMAFVLFHLSHFTWGFIQPESYGLIDGKQRFDIYTMLINDFSNTYISALYILALSCLGLHLSHGFFSVFQTFSIISVKETIHKFRKVSQLISVVIVFGYVMIPTSILFNIIS
jgi:succinate dehydrogenase / fumarate reductase cytochrome b subunit